MNLFSATQPLRDRPAFGYVFGLVAIALSVAVCFALGDTARLFPFAFLALVVLTTFLGGVRPGLVAAVLTGAAAKHLPIEPVGSFALAWPTRYLAMGFFTLTVASTSPSSMA